MQVYRTLVEGRYAREMSIQLYRPWLSRSILSSVQPRATRRVLSQNGLSGSHSRKPLIRSTVSIRASSSVLVQDARTEAAVSEQQPDTVVDSGRSQMSAAEGCLRFINYAWTQFHAVGAVLAAD